MSYFICCMFIDGLIEIPPVSKVTPLPTSTRGRLFFAFDGEYSRTNMRGECCEPLPTATIPPQPIFLSCSIPNTFAFSPSCFESVRTYFS